MRNVFDQYVQPENRLTHALMVTLANDRKLVRPFLKLLGAGRIPPLKNIDLGLQRVPGQEVDSEKDGKQGLPDGCFFDQDGWAVVIESKVQAGVSVSQLKRHRKTSARYGYEQPHVALISVDKPKSLPDWTTHIEWKNLYRWFSKRTADSQWARHFVDYMHVFESKMIAIDYDIRGTLTMFDGFKFSDAEPYTYAEGKRLIRLLGDELRKRKKLVTALDVVVEEAGRSKITKGNYGAVWDRLALKMDRRESSATAHMSFGIRPKEAYIAYTVPNPMTGMKKILRNAKAEGLKRMFSQVEENLRPILEKVKTAKPMIYIYQRHYKTQSSYPETDGLIEVDLRTILSTATRAPKHKYQPGWLECIFELLVNKESNMQLHVQLNCPHSDEAMQSPKAIDIMVDAWVAMKPLMDFVTGRRRVFDA